MKITEIQIKNFGRLRQMSIHPYPGINVIYGDNESGKSTMQQFITGMLFGMEKQRGRAGKNDVYQQYEPWDSSSFYAGAMRFQLGEKAFLLERNFYHKEKTARLVNEQDAEQLSVEHGDLEMLLGGVKKATYENTYCISQTAVETGKEFSAILQNYFVNASHTGEGDINFTGAQKKLKERQKETAKAYRKEQELRTAQAEKRKLQEEMIARDVQQLERQMEPFRKLEGEQEQPWISSMEEVPAKSEKNRMAEYLRQERDKKEEVYYRRRKILSLAVLAAAFLAVLAGVSGMDLFKELPVRILAGVLWAAGLGGSIFFGRRESAVRNAHREREQQQETEGEVFQEEEHMKQKAVARMLQEQLMEKKAALRNIREELEEYKEPGFKELELKQQMDACGLALATLQDISEHVYEDIRERLEGEISGIFSAVTHGKYSRVALDEQMNLAAYQESRKLYPWQLSRGTMEQMYFALRLGAGRFFTEEEPLPVLLDEVFAAFDEKRLEQALRWLSGQPEQIFLFTCQKREMELLEKNRIPYGKIVLQTT